MQHPRSRTAWYLTCFLLGSISLYFSGSVILSHQNNLMESFRHIGSSGSSSWLWGPFSQLTGDKASAGDGTHAQREPRILVKRSSDLFFNCSKESYKCSSNTTIPEKFGFGKGKSDPEGLAFTKKVRIFGNWMV